MASYSFDQDEIWRQASKQRLHTQKAIAEAAGIGERTVWKIIHGGQVNGNTAEKLSVGLGLGKDFQSLLTKRSRGQTSLPIARDEEGVPTTVLTARSLQGTDRQDVKLVLASRDLSNALASGRGIPSFAECLKASKVCTAMDDTHKDHPFLPSLNVNHFIQPSLVVTLDVASGPKVLGYARAKKPMHPGHVHTVGMSMLFGCSPVWNVVRQPQTPLDVWLDLTTADAADARHTLVAGECPVVLQLAQYKIDLVGYKCRIWPLGVITKDERRQSFNRIYTQYVFQVRLAVTVRHVDQMVKRIPVDGMALYRLASDQDAEVVFAGKEGRVNMMDIVAWQALHCDEMHLEYGHAKFWRGFAVV